MKKAAIILIATLLLVAGLLEWGLDNRLPSSAKDEGGKLNTATRVVDFLGGVRQYLAYTFFVKADKLDHEYYGSSERERALVPYLILITMLDPNYVSAYYIGSGLIYDLGQEEEAIDFNLEGLKSNPDSSDLYFSLGVLYLREGRYQEALETFEKAAKFEPAFPARGAITKGMIACYKAMGQGDKAMRLEVAGGISGNVLKYDPNLDAERWKAAVNSVNKWWDSASDSTNYSSQ